MGIKQTTTYICDNCGKEHDSTYGMMYLKWLECMNEHGIGSNCGLAYKYYCNEECLIDAIVKWKTRRSKNDWIL